MAGAGTEADILIQDVDRAPIDNRPISQGDHSSSISVNVSNSNKTPVVKKKQHVKKLVTHKDKWPKEQREHNPSVSGQGSNTAAPDPGKVTNLVPGEEIVTPPEIINAIKLLLRDDFVQICQQACQQAIDNRGNQSPSSSTSGSTILPPNTPLSTPKHKPPPSTPKPKPYPNPPPKKRVRDREGEKIRPWLTKAAKKHLAQHPTATYSDDEESQDEEEDDDGSEPFSSTLEQDQDLDQEDHIARFFNTNDYQQLLIKCLLALDLKDKPPEGGTSGATGAYTHPQNPLWGSRDYFPNRSVLEKVFPFPIFEQQLRAEWEMPATTRRPPQPQ